MARELAPAGPRSGPKPSEYEATDTPHPPIYDCFAAEREQAPSPRAPHVSQVSSITYPASPRLRSICCLRLIRRYNERYPKIRIRLLDLVNEPFVLACRRDHELAARSAVTWSELSDYRLIGVGRLSGDRMLLDHALSGLSWRPQWFYEVQHLSTSLGLVEAGLGVSAMPSLAMPAEDHPTLVSVPLIEPVVNRSLGLVYRRGASLSPAAEKFVSILLEQ